MHEPKNNLGFVCGQVSTVQRTLVEAWSIIRETYVDSSFNNQDWDKMLQDSLADTLSLTTSEEAYSRIRAMLGSLGDPFTRIVTPQVRERHSPVIWADPTAVKMLCEFL